jgi:hypothetical protein
MFRNRDCEYMKCEYCGSGITLKLEQPEYVIQKHDFYICRDCGRVTVI